jgi:hypothetical protein
MAETADTVIDGFTILNGQNDYGGGFYFVWGSSPTIKNCKIIDNNATLRGGGIDCFSGASPTFINCLIAGNTAGRSGGVECITNSQATFINCTIAHNYATSGGGVAVFNNSQVTCQNCIIWGNSPQQIYVDSGAVYVTYSDVQGGWAGTGNIDADPLFVTGPASHGDYYLSQTAAGQPDQSLCVDAGDPASPLIEGTTCTIQFPDSGAVDMGYHYPILAALGDFDGDGDVDLNDFATFALCYGGAAVTTPPPGCSEAEFGLSDLDGDNDVDLGDFATFANNYTGAQ